MTKLKTASSILLLILFIQTIAAQQIRGKAEIAKPGKNGSQILQGDVRFKQNDYIIYCDEAEFYEAENRFFATGNVKLKRGNDFRITSKTLEYDGHKKVGKFRKNVKLEDGNIVLTTEFLDFNTNDNSGYFYNGGTIVDSTNVLESRNGYYYPQSKTYFFKDSVVVTNPKYKIFSDTLKYFQPKEQVFVFGPTRIYSDSNFIYCENGWYDMKNEKAQISRNSYLINKKQKLKADSIYFEKLNGFGKAYRNVELTDSAQNIIIRGNYATYYSNPEKAMVTDSAILLQITQNDTLYLHADTLRSLLDTSGRYKILKAYKRAKIFKTDFQAACDSLEYSLKDSTITMHSQPILWAFDNQITADKIDIFTKNSKIDKVELYNTAFLVSEADTGKYNQVKGKNMTGFFRENRLYKVEVRFNSQSNYFPKDKDEISGFNKAESRDMDIYMTNNKIDRIIFLSKPEATFFPLEGLSPEIIFLKGFEWLIEHKPRSKNDIFIWNERTKNLK